MLTCTCDGTSLVAIPNDPCSAPKWGEQIVGIFVQRIAGSPFDGVPLASGTTGGDITLVADWEAKMAALDDDKIVFLHNLAGTEVADVTRRSREGNDVPYGGLEILNMARSFSGRIQYPNNDTITAVNSSRCWGKVRVWILDNNGYLQGGDAGIENVNVNVDALKRPGIGSAIPTHFPFSVDWEDIEEKAMSDTALTFLKTLDNAA